jgi:hypothetical protein
LRSERAGRALQLGRRAQGQGRAQNLIQRDRGLQPAAVPQERIEPPIQGPRMPDLVSDSAAMLHGAGAGLELLGLEFAAAGEGLLFGESAALFGLPAAHFRLLAALLLEPTSGTGSSMMTGGW